MTSCNVQMAASGEDANSPSVLIGLQTYLATAGEIRVASDRLPRDDVIHVSVVHHSDGRISCEAFRTVFTDNVDGVPSTVGSPWTFNDPDPDDAADGRQIETVELSAYG